MRVLKILGLVVLMILIAQGRTFAERPEISADETYFDIFKGAYVLKGNVHVAANNHGFVATITADEALVNVAMQRCWANGNVKLKQEDITFSCARAYLQWQTSTVNVVGAVHFVNRKGVDIKSDTAVFDWQKKIVDFYGAVTLAADKSQFANGVEVDGTQYQHVKYNVVENKILALDKIFDAPEIIIPDPE